MKLQLAGDQIFLKFLLDLFDQRPVILMTHLQTPTHTYAHKLVNLPILGEMGPSCYINIITTFIEGAVRPHN